MADFNEDIEVISFSTYLGDTRLYDVAQPNDVVTTAVKSKLYIGSNLGYWETIVFLKGVFEQFHIALTDMPNILDVRSTQ